MAFRKTKKIATLVVLTSVLGIAGCQTTNGSNNALTKGALGAAGGAAIGAIIGNNAGDGDAQSGALIGAVIGGAGGAYAGCRQDGGCGAQQRTQPRTYQQNNSYGQQRPTSQPTPTVNKRQYYDSASGRYFYYDPATRQEFYENGEHKYK